MLTAGRGDFFVTYACTVWRNESATLTQLCQNTSVRRLQVCFRSGSAGGQQANSSESIPRRWRTRSWNPRSRMKTTRSSATSLPIWKVTSSQPFLVNWQGKIAMCMPVASMSNDHSISNSETELETFQGDTHIANRKISRQNIRLNSCSFTLKERSDSDDTVRQKSSKKQLKVTCWWCRDAMLTFCKVRDRGVCGPGPRAWTCYGTPWQQHGRLRTCAHHVERRRKCSLERRGPSRFWKKVTPGMSDSFETWQEYFWTIDASFKHKKEVDGELDESIKRSASDRLGDLVPQVRARTSPGVFHDMALQGLCLELSFNVLYCRTQANPPTLVKKRIKKQK